jgi:HAMP domain-containing protein
VTDLPTLEGWIAKLGFATAAVDATTLRIRPPAAAGAEPLPPFIVQWTPNWVVLSILPILAPGEYRAEDLGRRLLAANRDMRLAKFALDENRAVVLCAELPTESLDYSEVASAIERMVQYARRFRAELLERG